ncbi:Dam family site-specific DNA-(adenine-N6)-methyltransferase [Oscillibacter sp.]|jgi:DNA adenine methylase|uniref:Dam family site-specific DNA-(adenine-N6)-methyltransferase n=1 Tax=Oscillibacter sp. TaxID=1945593 RepID=UPI00216C8FA6|nr:Dam family site-specific DNA-(adenine-N6)-methyltransferase [Oscillibacter sp.]MCI9649217.1 Dam family site-specific DNA-(adenine-N6)-methyltransferase [Oscillibacter sp.]
MVPALLKWIGNKQRFASIIVANMPTTFNNYYEPFLGSGAVLAELLMQDDTSLYPHFNHAYGSDILPFLIDIFRSVKENPNKIIEYYSKEISSYYENPAEQYELIRNRFNQDHNAFDFCLLSRTCYSGVIRFRKADGYMSTPKGPHNPIKPSVFANRVALWSNLIQKADFYTESFEKAMAKPQQGDVIYCDPPYTHSQSIIYGAQDFNINILWNKIAECKDRGAYVMLSINGSRESKKKDISIDIPTGLFDRELTVNCGTSMIDRLQNSGKDMVDEVVHDKLLLTW